MTHRPGILEQAAPNWETDAHMQGSSGREQPPKPHMHHSCCRPPTPQHTPGRSKRLRSGHTPLLISDLVLTPETGYASNQPRWQNHSSMRSEMCSLLMTVFCHQSMFRVLGAQYNAWSDESQTDGIHETFPLQYRWGNKETWDRKASRPLARAMLQKPAAGNARNPAQRREICTVSPRKPHETRKGSSPHPKWLISVPIKTT